MVRSPPFTTFWRRLADDDAPGGEVPFALAAECRLWRGKPTAFQAVAASANDVSNLSGRRPTGDHRQVGRQVTIPSGTLEIATNARLRSGTQAISPLLARRRATTGIRALRLEGLAADLAPAPRPSPAERPEIALVAAVGAHPQELEPGAHRLPASGARDLVRRLRLLLGGHARGADRDNFSPGRGEPGMFPRPRPRDRFSNCVGGRPGVGERLAAPGAASRLLVVDIAHALRIAD